ncbi:hypothetical protein TIFTF001_031017 [Ficus carica]|uniref:Uncharacterized protein n=1 Tax=Ficus carica TaxID=3494 RepID=A0AA88DUM0_FICCA|nr:hypothetical protein TIFTF001_031017 [Ficus carica]
MWAPQFNFLHMVSIDYGLLLISIGRGLLFSKVNQTWFTVHPVVSVVFVSPLPCPLFTTLVLLPTDAHLLLVSGAVAVPPNPSTICCLPGPPFTGCPSSLPFAFLIVDLLASPTPREADAAPTGVCEVKANPWADYPLFPTSEIISPAYWLPP